jgi:hypothetical protein
VVWGGWLWCGFVLCVVCGVCFVVVGGFGAVCVFSVLGVGWCGVGMLSGGVFVFDGVDVVSMIGVVGGKCVGYCRWV